MIKQQVTETRTASSKLKGLPDEKQLKDLGFEKLSKKLSKRKHLKKMLAIAYEHYLRLTEKASIFLTMGSYWGNVVVSIRDYSGEIPPSDVLLALKKAQERKCFGEYRIILKGKDPILLGRVIGWKSNRSLGHREFVIAHWGDDFDPEWLEKSME